MSNNSLKSQLVTVITRKSLVEALKKISIVMNGKSSIPVFSLVKFDITEANIQITGMNGDAIAVTTLEHSYPYEKASFVIIYQQLNDFLKKTKSDLIEFDTSETSTLLSIKSGRIKFDLLKGDVEEYPRMPLAHFDFLEMKADDFKTAMKNTSFACATSEARPVLTGVNISNDSHKQLRFVATDSHRLACYTFQDYKKPGNEKSTHNVTIPNATLSKIFKMIGKNTKLVTIGFDAIHTLFKFDDVEYWVRNLEGNYPDIERLIPEDYKTTVNLFTDELIEASNALSILAKHDRNNVIRLDHTDEKTTLDTNSPELGKMTAELIRGHVAGQDLKISFSSKFFTDALKALDSETVTMNFTGNMRPFIMTNPQDEKALHLILPVRTY